jgi:hypothetical protein
LKIEHGGSNTLDDSVKYSSRAWLASLQHSQSNACAEE